MIQGVAIPIELNIKSLAQENNKSEELYKKLDNGTSDKTNPEAGDGFISLAEAKFALEKGTTSIKELEELGITSNIHGWEDLATTKEKPGSSEYKIGDKVNLGSDGKGWRELFSDDKYLDKNYELYRVPNANGPHNLVAIVVGNDEDIKKANPGNQFNPEENKVIYVRELKTGFEEEDFEIISPEEYMNSYNQFKESQKNEDSSSAAGALHGLLELYYETVDNN